RRRLRRAVPALTHGPAVVLLLAVPLPQHDAAVAAVPQPARLGRVRGVDLLHRVALVLVHRPDPGPGDAARPLAEPAGPGRLRRAGDGLARLGPALAALRGRLSLAGRPGHAAGRLGAHGRQLRLRGGHPAGLAL